LSGEEEIATSFHPVRWTAVLAVAVPFALAVGFLVARLGANQELARTCARAFRTVLVIEVVALLGVAFFGLRYERLARRQEAAQFHPPGRLVEVGGYRLHLYCAGAGGPTVVLEHGHRATYLDWYRVQPAIAKFTRVCSYDRAGYGWSEPRPGERTPSAMADELHSALYAAGEKAPYILVGHSFGAMNAVMFAHQYPGEMAGLVLVDGSTPESLHPARWREQLWLRTIQLTMPFGLPRWRGWCDSGPRETIALKRALTCRPQNIQTIFREDAGFPTAANEIRGISTLGSTPLVVIARDPASGGHSEFEARHAEQQREMTNLSTNSEFIVAEASAHDVPLARPDVIVEAVKSLLKPQAQAGSRGTP
jgi:pimeloyl-ACP methyl ester carboxylesterase